MSVSLSLNGPQIMSAGPTVNVSNDNSFGQSGMAIEINPTNPTKLAGIVQHVGGMNEIDVYRSAGDPVTGGPGFFAVFDPGERHEVRARSDARLLLVLAPWPGDGHPGARDA